MGNNIFAGLAGAFRRMVRVDADSRSAECPSCGQGIFSEWRLCPHCGCLTKKEESNPLSHATIDDLAGEARRCSRSR